MPDHNSFKLAKVYHQKYDRTMLPFLRPADEKISIFGILKKFIGYDMIYDSMPVIINEPIGTLQKTCEMLALYQDLLVKAAKHEDPLMRLTLACVSVIAGFSCVKVVRKKPFNPVLDETFEYVSESFSYDSE